MTHPEPRTAAWYRNRLIDFSVPEHDHDGLIRWLTEGLAPGSFLTAVLSNDLREACARADPINQTALCRIVRFLANDAPLGSWGSAREVEYWYATHQARRAESETP